MKIHLSQIPPEGLHLEGEENCPIADLEELRCLGPLRYALDLGTSNGALWAQGRLAQKVELQCVACLEKFAHEIKVPSFALHMELPGPETIEITSAVREDLVLNLPAHPRCDRDGGRKCKAAARVEAAGSAAESKREQDWGELDRLKIKKR